MRPKMGKGAETWRKAALHSSPIISEKRVQQVSGNVEKEGAIAPKSCVPASANPTKTGETDTRVHMSGHATTSKVLVMMSSRREKRLYCKRLSQQQKEPAAAKMDWLAAASSKMRTSPLAIDTTDEDA